MNFIVKMFIVISISFAIQLKCKRTFAEAISVAVMTIIMTLYAFTLFMPLTYSGVIVAGMSAVAFAYCVIYMIRSLRMRETGGGKI